MVQLSGQGAKLRASCSNLWVEMCRMREKRDECIRVLIDRPVDNACKMHGGRRGPSAVFQYGSFGVSGPD